MRPVTGTEYSRLPSRLGTYNAYLRVGVPRPDRTGQRRDLPTHLGMDRSRYHTDCYQYPRTDTHTDQDNHHQSHRHRRPRPKALLCFPCTSQACTSCHWGQHTATNSSRGRTGRRTGRTRQRTDRRAASRSSRDRMGPCRGCRTGRRTCRNRDRKDQCMAHANYNRTRRMGNRS